MKTSEVHRFIKDIFAALCKNADITVWSDYRDRVWAIFGKKYFLSDGYGIQFIKESEDNYGEIHFGKFVDGHLDVSEGYTGTILDSSFKSDTEEAQRIANIIHSYTIENATTEGKRQMKKKYELTDETINWYGHTLHRIRALKDFNNVDKGDLGGYVESEKNLSQMGECWVYDRAKVYENGQVYGNAHVHDTARVFGDAEVYGDAGVFDESTVCDAAQVFDFAEVSGKAAVQGNSKVFEHAEIFDNALVFGDAWVYGNAKVYNSASVRDDAEIYDNAQVSGNAIVNGNTKVFGNSWFNGNAEDEEEAKETERREAFERLRRAGIVDENGELAKEYRTEEEPDNEPEPTALAKSPFPTREELDELNEIGLAGVMRKYERQKRWNTIWFWILLLISYCCGVVDTLIFKWIFG